MDEFGTAYSSVVAGRNLNAWQLQVLKWIVAGCPDGVMTGATHKTTAIALQGRRLIVASKRQGVWQAEATAAGRFYVEHGRYPDHHWVAADPATTRRVSRPPPRPRRVPVAPARSAKELRPAEQLIADVIDAGGTLDVSDRTRYPGGLIASATRSTRVPPGKLLRLRKGRGWDNRDLELVDRPAGVAQTPVAIPVPERLGKPHPAVASLRADCERLVFRSATRQRALLILDAVAKEATRRGHHVTGPARSRLDDDSHPGRTGDITVTIAGHAHGLRVTEEQDKTPHEATAQKRGDRDRWLTRIPKYDHSPSGRLVINVTGGSPVHTSRFRDTKTFDLATRLPDLLQELELRAVYSQEVAIRRETDASEQRQRWEQAQAEAIVARREQHRADLLRTQATDWHDTQRLTGYVEAMRHHVATLNGYARTQAEEWLAWATSHTEGLNPLNRAVAMPPESDAPQRPWEPFQR